MRSLTLATVLLFVWNSVFASSQGLPSAIPVAVPVAETVSVDRGSLHFGTYVRSKIFGKTTDEAESRSALLEAELERLEDELSVHRDTPLNAVNRRAGEIVEIPTEAAELIRAALAAAEETEGYFQPMLGPVIALWGIGFGGNREPEAKALEEAMRHVSLGEARVREENGRYFACIGEGQSLDTGGIAKGFIAMRAVGRLKDAGMTKGLLDLGGDVAAIGEKSAGVPWRIGIQHPEKARGQFFAVIKASDEYVLSSGAYERYFVEKGRRFAHIIDPTTGRPAATDLSSVTVVDRDAVRADALATALFAMGSKKAEAFLAERPGIRAVLLETDSLKGAVTRSALSNLIITDETVTLSVIGSDASVSTAP